MARTKKEKNCRCLANEICYSPTDRKQTDEPVVNILDLAEFEAMRLCDLEGKSQISAADEMGISRGTVQRVLETV